MFKVTEVISNVTVKKVTKTKIVKKEDKKPNTPIYEIDDIPNLRDILNKVGKDIIKIIENSIIIEAKVSNTLTIIKLENNTEIKIIKSKIIISNNKQGINMNFDV